MPAWSGWTKPPLILSWSKDRRALSGFALTIERPGRAGSDVSSPALYGVIMAVIGTCSYKPNLSYKEGAMTSLNSANSPNVTVWYDYT